MESLEEMGKKAHQKQVFGYYREAIDLYTAAIKKHGEDKRLLNNKCMCHIKIKEFNKALIDTDKLIKSYPNYKKSFYRRGEIMKLLKRYLEAEEAFLQVLKLDSNCEEARQQLLETQILEICSKHPFTQLQANDAVTATGNIEDAVSLLKSGAYDISYDSDLHDDDVYYSDEEVPASAVADSKTYDPLTDPTNPLGCCTLWVGSITEGVTEKMLNDLFSKYGHIVSLYVYHNKTCAFVNYKDPVSPGKAMKALQGYVIGGREMMIKFPDSAYKDAANKKKQKHP